MKSVGLIINELILAPIEVKITIALIFLLFILGIINAMLQRNNYKNNSKTYKRRRDPNFGSSNVLPDVHEHINNPLYSTLLNNVYHRKDDFRY